MFSNGSKWVQQEDCRQLERELTEVTKQRDRLLEQREQWRMSSVCRELTAQRDRLAEALRLATAYPLTESWYNQAIEALATLKPCD
jgi:hypothetical protein